ncbi:MAG: DNA/RNA nuclease SfsA [Caldilineaceae bacterium]|nr:DNA/RNA nuclease SfsA [Caldilineaceae bacterium]
MNFDFTTQPATFLARPNRFRIEAQLHESGRVISAHCPDPGRLLELLIPGVTVHVSPANNPARKTAWDLRFVEHPEHGQLISLDSRLPNQLFAEGLAAGFFAPFANPQKIAREMTVDLPHTHGVRSRIDYRLIDAQGRPCWIEVKSATLVEEGWAYFPDAVTVRGRRHVEELTALVKRGDRAAITFIIQRPDAAGLSPQWTADPDFARALVAADAVGVEIYAYTCCVTLQSMTLAHPVPVVLAGDA